MLSNVRNIQKKKLRVRLKIKNLFRTRISLFKSNKHFYVQIVDDSRGVTIASASTLEPAVRVIASRKVNASSVKAVAELVASRLKSVGFNHPCVFDRGSYPYKGNIAIFADQLRNYGLKF